MKIRTKFFLITGVVFLSLIIISSLSMWTMNEINKLKRTIDKGTGLIADSRKIHGHLKDLMFDIFTPQTYRLLKDIIYAPRFQTGLRVFHEEVETFESSFSDFMNLPQVKRLLREEELKDEYEVALRMSKKAFQKIDSINRSLDKLVRRGVLGEARIYERIQSDQDESLIMFFDEVRMTSYYLNNNFESFLNHFIHSLQEQSRIIQKQILILFWLLSAAIGLAVILFSNTFAHRISTRIKIVEKVIKKVSRGDFTVRLNIDSHDEFSTLSDNFNLFIIDLKRNVDSLLNLMRDVGVEITNQLNPDRIFELIAESAVKDTNADGAAVLMTGEHPNRLKIKAKAGVFPAAPFNVDYILVKGSLLEKVFRRAEPLFIKDTAGGNPILYSKESDRSLLAGVGSLLAIPLVISKRVSDLLVIVKSKDAEPLTDLDYTNLKTYADYAALVIDNFFKYNELLEKRKAEYMALQSQIQPHFLYNVLNGLIGLNRLGDKKSLEKAIFSLKDMLRYTLEQAEWTTVAEEFCFLEKYCALQKMRFRERLEVDIRHDPETADLKIPKLILQPLVENAVIHGIEPLGRKGNLSISASIIEKSGCPCLGILISTKAISGLKPCKAFISSTPSPAR
ncbi:MAG: HAMP domain-containing protein [Spirochaeta sp.]|nr:HAMP domain-containing protein [Spirochaeta sp.]